MFPTGLCRARNLLTARSCDGLIMGGGSTGTLNELTIAYAEARPVVILRGSHGSRDAGGYVTKAQVTCRPGQGIRQAVTKPATRLIGASLLLLSLTARPAPARVVPGFGEVVFPTSCAPAVQAGFEAAIARLHAFDGPEDAFRAVAATDPHCAIAWWGVAMTVRGNPLAGAPGRESLLAGQAAIARASAAGAQTPREAGLIGALAVYYRDPAEDHTVRTRAYEAAMRHLAAAYPDDVEIQTFYALAILEAVDLTDKGFTRQLEAARILEPLWAANPHHPGIPHYLIHAYDYPPLAVRGLPAARAYAAIAPAGHHALHMPSHIYSMLGLWRESIAANREAAALHGQHAPDMAAMDADDAHGLDFIAYAHLQLGQDDAVRLALADAPPSDERVLVEARFLLERGDWAGAASMQVDGLTPFQLLTARFVRAFGAARTGQIAAARAEAGSLRSLRDPILREGGAYWAGLADVYAGAVDGWIAYAAGDLPAALGAMRQAADADDAREKHILLENKLYPIRELYADLLLSAGLPDQALAQYQTSLQAAPNRFNGYLGASRAAHALDQQDLARLYAAQASALLVDPAPGRPTFAEVSAAQ